MVCIMTFADGQTLNHRVIEGINKQSLKIDILPITRPVSFYDDEDACKGLKSMTDCRNLAKELILKENEFVLFLDSDVVLTNENSVLFMINELKKDPLIGACAINTKRKIIDFEKNEKNHLCTACMVIRKKVLDLLVFRNADHNVCNCVYLTKDIYSMGYVCKYLTNISAYEIDRQRHFI